MIMKYLTSIATAALLMFAVNVPSYAGELAKVHEDADVTCMDCHGTDTPTRRGKTSLCKNCHGDQVEIKEFQVEERVVNVHKSPHGEIRCTACHKTHEPSVLYCNDCHQYEVELP